MTSSCSHRPSKISRHMPGQALNDRLSSFIIIIIIFITIIKLIT